MKQKPLPPPPSLILFAPERKAELALRSAFIWDFSHWKTQLLAWKACSTPTAPGDSIAGAHLLQQSCPWKDLYQLRQIESYFSWPTPWELFIKNHGLRRRARKGCWRSLHQPGSQVCTEYNIVHSSICPCFAHLRDSLVLMSACKPPYSTRSKIVSEIYFKLKSESQHLDSILPNGDRVWVKPSVEQFL